MNARTEEVMREVVEWVCMPAWKIAKSSPKKWVRVVGFLLSIPTFVLFSVLVLFPFMMFVTFRDIYRDL